MKRVPALFLVALLAGAALAASAGQPFYEDAYVNDRIVTISVQDPHPGKTAPQGYGQYFEVIYPVGWEALTDSIPLCNPCDHVGDGDDFFDYHDHVFSGEPSNPADGTYRPLWQLNFVLPAYTGDEEHDAVVAAAFAAHLPVTSKAAVDALLAATLADGSPVAIHEPVDYVFKAAIVNDNARR